MLDLVHGTLLMPRCATHHTYVIDIFEIETDLFLNGLPLRDAG